MHDEHEGHDHSHDHDHDHGHAHEHSHEHNHDHGEYSHDEIHDAEINALEAIEPGVVAVTVHEHDGAIVASGALILYSDEPLEMRHAVADEVEFIGSEIGRCGGVVGHVKASFVATSYDMLSVTEAGADVELKRAPELELKIGLTAIAFGVPEEFMRNLIGDSLQNLL